MFTKKISKESEGSFFTAINLLNVNYTLNYKKAVWKINNNANTLFYGKYKQIICTNIFNKITYNKYVEL